MAKGFVYLAHAAHSSKEERQKRVRVVDTGVTRSYAPNNLNQYTTGESLGVTNGPEHEIQSFNGVLYTYMNDERLSSAATTSGLSIGNSMYQLVYDALGRCVKRNLNGLVTYYVYDGEKPILEYAAGGASVGVNLYGKGIDEILERVAIGSDNQWHIYFFQQNHEGSVTLLTDTAGNVIERYRYDVFGAPTIYDGNWNARSSTIYDNRFLFTGREYAATYRSTYNTPAFNFYEYRARAYNPQLGRFMSEDPKGFDAGDYNLFRYCHNDPEDFTDPMGTLEQYHDVHYTSAKDAMAEWMDRSNNFQGTFAEFTALHGLTMGQQVLGAQVHDPVKDGKNYQQSSSREKLVNVMAEQVHDRMEQERANPRVSEVSTYISQANDGSSDYLGHPLTLQHARQDAMPGSEIFVRGRDKDPSPDGYHVVAGIVAQRVYRDRMSRHDQHQFRKAGYDGYTVVPGDYRHRQPFYIRPYHYPDEPQ